jgi:hypothetical protein
MKKGMLILSCLFMNSAWGSYFTNDSVLYTVRRVPLEKCSSINGANIQKPGFNCVPDQDYDRLASSMPAGIAVKRLDKEVTIPPFAMRLCAITSTQLRSSVHQNEQNMSCSGYLPLSQEAGLSESEGRLYLLLNESRMGRNVKAETWDTYLLRYRYPQILELPIRGDRMMTFLEKKIQHIEGFINNKRALLKTKFLKLDEDKEVSPVEFSIIKKGIKEWEGLKYFYGQLLESQGIPSSDFEEILYQIIGDKYTTPLWNSVDFKRGCAQKDRSWFWNDVQGSSEDEENSVGDIEWRYFRVFMHAIALPWLCEKATNYLTVSDLSNDSDDDLVLFKNRFDHFIKTLTQGSESWEDVLLFMKIIIRYSQYDKDPLLLKSDMKVWLETVYRATQNHFQRILLDNSIASVYIDMNRIDSQILRFKKNQEVYEKVISERSSLDHPLDQYVLSPNAVSELFDSRAHIEDFSESTVDSYLGQMRSEVLALIDESVLRESTENVYNEALAYFRRPHSYDAGSEPALQNIFGGAYDWDSLGVDADDETSLLLPKILRQIREKVMAHLEMRIKLLSVAHEYHRDMIRNVLNQTTVTHLLLGGFEIEPVLEKGWAEFPTSPEADLDQIKSLKKLLASAQEAKGTADPQVLQDFMACYEKKTRFSGWSRRKLTLKSPGCESFLATFERGFQQLDWIVYYYEKLFDTPTLNSLGKLKFAINVRDQRHFEKYPGLGKMVVKAEASSSEFEVTDSPRKIYFAQEGALRPFESRLDGKSLYKQMFPITLRGEATPEHWQDLSQLYAQVTPCSTTHWCQVWQPHAFYQIVNDEEESRDIAPSSKGMPGYVSEVKIEEVIKGSPEYERKVIHLLGKTHPHQKPVYLFRVTSHSRSPNTKHILVFEQNFLVYAQGDHYDMMTQFNVATTKAEGGMGSTHDVKFVSLPVPLSYVHLYGLSEMYHVSDPSGFHILMKDFIEGFRTSYMAPEFVSSMRAYRKRWMPFSHTHSWSPNSNRVSLNAAGLVLVFDMTQGLIFRSDGPEHMGTRYLRASLDKQWNYHPYDHFPYGQFAGAASASHFNMIYWHTGSGIWGGIKRGAGYLGSWIRDSVLNLGIQTGQTYPRVYDSTEKVFKYVRRIEFEAGEDDTVDVDIEGEDYYLLTPAVKLTPTMPYHMGYTKPGIGYGDRLYKLAYEHNTAIDTEGGVIELFNQPELRTLFSPRSKDVWISSDLPIDSFRRAPQRSYLSHIDLRSQQRHPNLVNVISPTEAEGKKYFPSLSEWISSSWESLGADVSDKGWLKGMWLASRESFPGNDFWQDLENANAQSPYYHYNPKFQTIAMGEGEGVFAVTAFPYEYEQYLERSKRDYGETESGEASWPWLWMYSDDYWTRVADEIKDGSIQDRYRQYLLYVKFDNNDGPQIPEMGKPGLDVFSRHGLELENQVWGKSNNMLIPIPNMGLIDGMVLVGGQK